jgi:hypothetical protein
MSSENIQIEKLSIAQEQTATSDEMLITVVLSNPSASSTMYVLDKLRNLDYDQSSHTLSIGLFEKEPGVNKKVSHPFVPNQVPIPPQGKIELTFRLPMKLTRYSLAKDEPFGQKKEILDISTVEKVTCTVAYSEQTFQVQPKLAGEHILRDLSKWGKTVSGTFEVKL